MGASDSAAGGRVVTRYSDRATAGCGTGSRVAGSAEFLEAAPPRQAPDGAPEPAAACGNAERPRRIPAGAADSGHVRAAVGTRASETHATGAFDCTDGPG